MPINHALRSPPKQLLRHWGNLPLFFLVFLLTVIILLCNNSWAAEKTPIPSNFKQESIQFIPKAVLLALEKNQLPSSAISIAVTEIPANQKQNTKSPQAIQQLVNWRGDIGMNPASTMKILTTLTALDVLGPNYRWQTLVYTDGFIRNGILKGDLYLQGTGDPKLTPESLAKLIKNLRALGIQKIDGNLIFDRSAYDQDLLASNLIDGEALRSYNVQPDPLLYAFRTLSFQLSANKLEQAPEISYSPELARFKIVNQLNLQAGPCEDWRKELNFEISPESPPAKSGSNPTDWQVTFSGSFPKDCQKALYNVVAFDPNTFLALGFTAAWQLAGGEWPKPPQGKSGLVPSGLKPIVQYEGSSLVDAMFDINKYSNNVMARQVFLTLALDQLGKPATVMNSEKVIQGWLQRQGMQFPELVLENGSGLSRIESISAMHMNDLLIAARTLPNGELFYKSLPMAGNDGTMRNRLLNKIRGWLHLKIRPEIRVKTGSLVDVKAIAGYVLSKSGKLYAVSSFINHRNAYLGQEAHDQLLAWLAEDGPDPKAAR